MGEEPTKSSRPISHAGSGYKSVMREEIRIKDLGLKPFKALRERKSLGQHVFERLKGAIIQGRIPAGNRVVESRIAELLGISRTPVREAIHKLEREGLLTKLPLGGFSVAHFSRGDIEETFGIRSVLESYAAKLAAVRHQAEDLRPLEEKIDEFQIALGEGRMEALPKLNTEFHDLLYALSRSPRLIKMINVLREQIYRFRSILLKVEKMARIGNEDHKKMLRAMKKRDADRVERLVREHILRGQKIVLEELRKTDGDL